MNYQKPWNNPKIAVMRALRLGDMLCAVPAFRALRSSYQDAEITLLGMSWADEFTCRFNRYIDRHIAFCGYPGLKEVTYDHETFLKFLANIRKEKFDLVIQLHGSGVVTNPLIELFGAKFTAGSYVKGNFCPNINTFIEYSEDIPEIYRNLRVLQNIGISAQGDYLEFPVTYSDRRELEKWAGYEAVRNMRYICIHPGASEPARRWNPGYFADIANAMNNAGYRVVITGTPQEYGIIRDVVKNTTFKPVIAAGLLSIGATGALIKKARLVISNCTSISHIADALKVPSVVIYLDSDMSRWAPLDGNLHKRIPKTLSSNPTEVLTQVLRFAEGRTL